MATSPPPLRADVLIAWAVVTGDPARHFLHWLWEGAPAGIAKPIDNHGIFPDKDDMTTCTVDELTATLDYEGNYASLTDDPDAESIILDLIDPKKGWVRTFKCEADVVSYLEASRLSRNLASL